MLIIGVKLGFSKMQFFTKYMSIVQCRTSHDDVIKWKHFPDNWLFVRGIHRSPVNSPHKDQWRRALMFSLICAWIDSWVKNRKAGDLRRPLWRHCNEYLTHWRYCTPALSHLYALGILQFPFYRPLHWSRNVALLKLRVQPMTKISIILWHFCLRICIPQRQ